MKISQLHEWDENATNAARRQLELAKQVRIKSLRKPWETLVACDVSFSRGSDLMVAAVAAFDRNNMAEPIDQHTASLRTTFPYIPGFLSFRELPVILKALEGLKIEPDIVLCDGQGIAHPKKLGIASHLGVWLGLPTVGCGKSKLCGHFEEPGTERGDRSPLIHKKEKVGEVLRTRRNVSPVFVSPGHLCDFEDASQLVLELANPFRLPGPTRYVHELSNAARRAGEIRSKEQESEVRL